jgi:hypothetical protein
MNPLQNAFHFLVSWSHYQTYHVDVKKDTKNLSTYV